MSKTSTTCHTFMLAIPVLTLAALIAGCAPTAASPAIGGPSVTPAALPVLPWAPSVLPTRHWTCSARR
jgi:hypothetical protein